MQLLNNRFCDLFVIFELQYLNLIFFTHQFLFISISFEMQMLLYLCMMTYFVITNAFSKVHLLKGPTEERYL